MINFKGSNVHGPGNVTLTVKAVCSELLWIDLKYYEKRRGKKPIRKNLAIHLCMEDALTLADAIKNSYKHRTERNFKHLVKKLAGYSIG